MSIGGSPRGDFGAGEARRAWDRGADAWDDFVETGADYYRTETNTPSP